MPWTTARCDGDGNAARGASVFRATTDKAYARSRHGSFRACAGDPEHVAYSRSSPRRTTPFPSPNPFPALLSPTLPLLRAGMADETPTSDPTSAPTPIELDGPEGEWTTPGNVRKPRLAARPSFDLHAVCVHLPALPSATSAQLLDILPAFIRAAKLPAHTCADVSVHLRNRNRLAILKTHHIELASRLLSVESIVLAGRIYAVAPYLAAPTNSCRGVIHGIAPDATQEELLHDLDSYQADILLARRMGNTNSALITFAGMHVPFSVYYQRLEFRCRPHKPRAHHCTICLQYEHRTCACPGNQRLCPTCSTPISQPDEPHSCSPWCLHCQGHHTPFAEICPVRMQRDEACANAAKKQRLLHRQQWKSLNTSQPPVKPSSPSSIPKVRASSSLLPTHAQWGGAAPASDPGVTNPCDSTSTECTTEACGIPHACSGEARFTPAETCTPALQSPHYPNPPPPHWRVWLASAAFADQLAMVLLAEEYL
ncbi:hypothetical protein HPB49_010221 [Dermacentor silvarum]|uniref:Uncharacterized protein n=1 Tax=Dermacentor silvarum TaxID=543639 RepID=A0ACB8DYE3_DERSI|nr:hypothetical protein HPB49_010221 [Dermacentor silvarum]